LHVVDVAPTDPDADPVADARAIVAELKKYDPTLHRKPRWLVLNKIDLVAPHERTERIEAIRRRLRTKAPVFAISAATGEGCRELMWAVQRFLFAEKPVAAATNDPRFATGAPLR
jgi:GTP-binding protein